MSKVITIQDNSPRFLLSVFNDYQGEIGDLVLAINVVRLALEAELRGSRSNILRRWQTS